MSTATTASLEECLEECRELLDAPADEVASAWKASHPGGKVVGCFPVYAPVELIHASGGLPLGVIGGGNQLEIAHADARFQSFVCSIVKSTLELGLIDELQSIDFMLFQSICDPARNLSSVFKRNFPDLGVEYLHLPQNLTSPRVLDYLVAEFRRILERLEEYGCQAPSNDDVNRSIAAYNRARALVRELYEIRCTAPERLSLSESYLLTRAGTRLDVIEYTALLERALAAIAERTGKRKDNIRVVIEGSFCEQPSLELLKVIEEAGCYIVDDDLLLGWRWFLDDVPLTEEPLTALASSFIDGSVYSGIKHDMREPKAKHLLDKVADTKADAVIILAAKFCEPALFDYALYKQALERAGIPHLLLEFDEKMWVFDSIRTDVETFVESMLFE